MYILSRYESFVIERKETPKKINFIFICQKCFKCYNLFRFYINLFFIFFRVSFLSIAKLPFHSFVVCPKCHKLYNKQEVKQFSQNANLSVMRCRHVEFPNSTTRKTKLCQTPLSQKINIIK